MIIIQIELREIYGLTKAYPRNQPAEAIARIAGTKTLTKTVLVNTLALGCGIEVLDRFGNVSRFYEPGRIEGLPQIG
jgi:hypothetical protein